MKLSDLGCCFEGVIPSKIATCSAQGLPNVTYVSHVQYVDEKHVATSFQFFSKTRRNLLENPFASILLIHPETLEESRLKVRYVRSETEGELFEKMSMRLKVIASYEGMADVFVLRAADVFEVLSIEAETSPSSSDLSQDTAQSLAITEALRSLGELLSSFNDLEHVFDRSLELFETFFGWKHSMILLSDDEGKSYVTHATRGYSANGVGSEARVGEGIIGLAVQHRRLLQLSGVDLSLRYAAATRKAIADSGQADTLLKRIPLPGLEKPASQVAAPLVVGKELLGVLVVESPDKHYWTPVDQNLVAIVANILANAINRFILASVQGVEVAPIKSSQKLETTLAKIRKLRFAQAEECLFLDDAYLIKNMPARILWYLLETKVNTGRDTFSNMELRSEPSLKLPDIKDNLEARLILLKKRLQQHSPDIRIVSEGRGRFRIETDCLLKLEKSP